MSTIQTAAAAAFSLRERPPWFFWFRSGILSAAEMAALDDPGTAPESKAALAERIVIARTELAMTPAANGIIA